MQVRILFFGMLKDLAGLSAESLEVRDGAVLADVLAHYEKRVPELRELLPSVAMSINREYAKPEAPLHAGDEIAFLPPVSGGAGKVFIVREKIDPDGIIQGIKRPEDGAIIVFDGIVRNHTRGRRTLHLDYEAYEEMAVKEMESLAKRAISDFKVRDVAIVHRLGRLEIGETSVLIVVASAHRAAAFDACRWVIDSLKADIAIWKKEVWEGGDTTWVHPD